MSRKTSRRRPAAAARKSSPKAALPKAIRPATTLSLAIAPSAWGVASGYGRAAFSLVEALKALGVKTAICRRPQLAGDGPPVDVEPFDDCEAVLHIGEPPTWRLVNGKRNIGLCWWPFSAMPPQWRKHLYGIDQLIVPSQWCADGAALVQPHQRLSIVPLGVDPSTFEPFERERGEQLRFLVFDSRAPEYKSGVDVAIAAFSRAFPSAREDVVMDVWGTYSVDVAAPDRRIQLRRHIGTDADLVRLYQRYDALIAPARGAGFGLVPLEAMATGMPVLHSGQAGYSAFAELGTLIGARKVAVPQQVQPLCCAFDPQIELLVDRLKQLDGEYVGFQEQAMRDAETVRARFTWEVSARALFEALGGSDVVGQSGDVPEPLAV